jgi:flagellar hook protein FlgE
MLPALNTGISGLQQFQQQINVIGNNISNVNTAGYKSARTDFEDTFSTAMGISNPGQQVGTGVTTGAVRSSFNQGTVTRTDVPSDLAVTGNGFFIVKDSVSTSQFYTRAGDFHLDKDGYLITNEGLRVQGYNDTGLATVGDIKIDANGSTTLAVSSYNIAEDGKITVKLSDGTQLVRGQVLLQNFGDTSQLVKEGNNLYSSTANAGPLPNPVKPQTTGTGAIQSGALELSNVDLTTEFSSLITAQRAFQANARIITTSDEVLSELVNLKR